MHVSVFVHVCESMLVCIHECVCACISVFVYALEWLVYVDDVWSNPPNESQNIMFCDSFGGLLHTSSMYVRVFVHVRSDDSCCAVHQDRRLRRC
jgi:hypothetical protein